MTIFLIVLAVVIVSLVAGFIVTFKISKKVYNNFFYKSGYEDWGRDTCTFPEDEECMEMFNKGVKWAEESKEYKHDVSIENEGLHLYGEYYDFGFNRCMIFLQGRGESLTYSYYFVVPYRSLGYNVLVVDQRATGKSDGVRINCGLSEYKDLLLWIDLVNKEFHNDEVLLHGVCIGSACALYAATDDKCPKCVNGIIVDGIYTTFTESFKNHIIYFGKPVFPVLQETMGIMHYHSGKSPTKFSPINCFPKLKIPVLMMCGKKDLFSLPEKSQELYDIIKSEKEIEWFEKGNHSHLRIVNEEQYDKAIKRFVENKL